MEKIYVDTNIILDWIANREPYFEFSKELFKKGENEEIEIWTSTMSFISTEYIMRKQIGKDKTKQALAGMRTICNVCNSGEKEIDLSILSRFKDFEDAFQYYNALNNFCKVIITRNAKDFSASEIPIMSAEEYIKAFNQKSAKD